MLGPGCEDAAVAALGEFPQGLQIGGKFTCYMAVKTDVNHALNAAN